MLKLKLYTYNIILIVKIKNVKIDNILYIIKVHVYSSLLLVQCVVVVVTKDDKEKYVPTVELIVKDKYLCATNN